MNTELMISEQKNSYPGTEMTHGQMLALAHEYRRIAYSLDALDVQARPIALAPYRFAAIHSIELYFNAYLVFKGFETDRLRSLNHDLLDRQRMAHEQGLLLRVKTIDRLSKIDANREYLSARYSIAHASNGLEFSEIGLILKEVSKKVTAKICNGK